MGISVWRRRSLWNIVKEQINLHLGFQKKYKIGVRIVKERKKAIINIILLALTLVINALGAFGFINGNSQKEVSDRYLTLITPSPSTFSIWSIIYGLLIVSSIVMIIKNDDYYKEVVNKITFLFRLSSLFNILWIVSFSYLQLELSILFIFGLLFTLSLILQKLLSIKVKRQFLIPLTFGMYTGWLFIATVVNISATLVKINWNGFGLSNVFWANTILIIAVILVFLVNLKNKNAIFPLPIAWAFYGINNFLKSPDGFSGMYPIIEKVTIGGIIALLIISIYRLYKNKYKIIPSN